MDKILNKKNIATALFLAIQCAIIVLCGLSTRPDLNWAERGRHEKQYEELTEAFLHGHLYLDDAPAAFLHEMENPYDPIARSIAAAENDTYFYIDTSYYNERYYIHFGPLPVVTAFIPLRIVTGSIPPTWIVVIIYGVMYVLVSWLFVEVLCERFAAAGIPRALRLFLTALWIAATGTPFLVSFCVSYSLPVLSALCYCVLGLSAWLMSPAGRPNRLLLCAGSVCIAATFAIREEFVLATLLAFSIFAGDIREGHFFRKDKEALKNTAAVMVPYLIICPPVMVYNALRFGDPLETGYSYLLTVSDLTDIDLSLTHFKAGITELLLHPLNISRGFPFIREVEIPDAVREEVYIEPMTGGFIAFNLIVLAVFLMLIPSVRRAMKKIPGAMTVALSSLVFAFVILIVDSNVAGISMRYQYDFGFLMMMSAFIVLLTLYGKSRYVTAAMIAFGILSIVSNYMEVFSDGRYFAMADTNPEVYWYLESLFSPNP